MARLAFVFSGQGAQYAGMGKSLYEGSTAAKTLLDTFEQIRPGTLEQCFSGPEETLKDTRNTQPCVFAVSMAAAAALTERGIRADALAGFSLGEVTALTFGGAFSAEDGFSLVMQRAEHMAEAAKQNPSSMLAILKLPAEQVKIMIKNYVNLYPVNYNCPGQTVVAGDADTLQAFQTAVKAAGGRAIPLKVSGGFHSPYMQSASLGFGETLQAYTPSPLQYPVYANLTAKPYGENITETLILQMTNPVRWQETVENMINDGVSTFIELGPGKTLKGFIEKCSNQARAFHVEDMESLEGTKMLC